MAKARVAPLKQLTLPKLELMTALTAVRLSNFITDALKSNSFSINLWTDSQIILHWIKGEKWNNAFVAHHISEIHNATDPNCWRYCPTLDNPADLLTRGINSTQLRSSTLWKHGPQWLPSYTSWPIWQPSPTLHLQALAVTTSDFIPPVNDSSYVTGIHCIIKIANYGTLSKLLGVTAFTCRFPTNCRKQQEDRLKGPLAPAEPHNAQTRWVKQSQKEVYSSIIDSLTSHSSLKRIPLVRQLRLFLDADSLIWCCGRIHNAPLSESAKFPILLPPKHMLTSLIIYSVHSQMFHAGTNTTLTAIRQQFWIPIARQSIKSLLRHCTTCRRHGGKPYATPDPPPLPEIRTRDTIPFTITGIDFTGALYVRQDSTENKVYICLFTCATSRVIHLEVVTDLTVESFLLDFRRITSRRSVPKIVMSDNASTYFSSGR